MPTLRWVYKDEYGNPRIGGTPTAMDAIEFANGKLRENGEFAVSVTDVRVPQMSGVRELLTLQDESPSGPQQDCQQDYRKELWIAIATSVAASDICTSSDVPVNWANKALAAFDECFGR